MRKRTVPILFYLSEEEDEKFREKVKRTEMSVSDFLRTVIEKTIILPLPVVDYPKEMEKMKAVADEFKDYERRMSNGIPVSDEEISTAIANTGKAEKEVCEAFKISC